MRAITPQPEAPFLLTLLITLLTPMFVPATGGNLDLARFAAAETIESYRAQTQADLIAIAQIIAFGLAALAGLSQSMDDTIPLATALRLRGNATACNRAAQQNRVVLTQTHPEPPPPAPNPEPEPEFDEAQIIAAVAATQKRAAEASTTRNVPTPTVEPTERQYQVAWANGAATVAAEIAAEIPSLPPNQRAEATMRAAVLQQCADELLAGEPRATAQAR
jgi:hypothetical protein